MVVWEAMEAVEEAVATAAENTAAEAVGAERELARPRKKLSKTRRQKMRAVGWDELATEVESLEAVARDEQARADRSNVVLNNNI